MYKRAIYKNIWDKLHPGKYLIMLAGPRQSGKTTFARAIPARDFQDILYIPAVQLVKKIILKRFIRIIIYWLLLRRDSFHSCHRLRRIYYDPRPITPITRHIYDYRR